MDLYQRCRKGNSMEKIFTGLLLVFVISLGCMENVGADISAAGLLKAFCGLPNRVEIINCVHHHKNGVKILGPGIQCGIGGDPNKPETWKNNIDYFCDAYLDPNKKLVNSLDTCVDQVLGPGLEDLELAYIKECSAKINGQ